MKCLLLLITLSSVSAVKWDRHLKLDPNYKVWWTIEENSITFQVEVATVGWVGFGLSPNGGMAGADVVIGWIDNDKVLFHDRYADGNALPEIDEQQDWNLLWHQKNDTHTKLRFQRSLDTCDEQDMPITDDTTRLIFAYSRNVPTSTKEIAYHGTTTRGTISVLLKQKMKHKFLEKKEDLRYWEVRSPHVEVLQTSDLQNYCAFFRAPVDGKHHAIKFEPVFTPGNEKLVHRMSLYECSGVTNETISKYNDKQYHNCYTKEQIPNFAFCLAKDMVWTVGGEAFYLPENTGLPLGTSVNEWFMLEVQYDNPSRKQVIDNSGLKITYTPVLRKYDSSILAIITNWFPSMVVPPKQKKFVVSVNVAPSCFNQTVPPEGIKVHSVLFHSHALGRRMIIRHFRGDKELEPIAEDKNYDFNYQQFQQLSTPHVIFPNDHIIYECTYDSSYRRNVTFGGLTSREEICFAYLMVYPKISLSIVCTFPLPRDFLTALGATDISSEDTFLVSPITGRNESYFEFLNGYSWNETSVDVMQHAMRFAPQTNMCTDRSFNVIPTSGVSTYPNVKEPYVEPSKCPSKRDQQTLVTRKPSTIATNTKNSDVDDEKINLGKPFYHRKIVLPPFQRG